jgi:tetratricopeptide (TPR) repeat protein
MKTPGSFAACAALVLATALLWPPLPARAADSASSAIIAQPVMAQSAAPARAADPQSFYHYALAAEALKAGRLSEAIAEYKKAAELDPTSPRLQRDLAAAYLAAHQPQEAVAAYRRALAIDPKDCDALYNLGRAAAAEKDYDAALGYFRQILELAGEPAANQLYGLALYQIAAVYDTQDRAHDAAQAFERLVQWLAAAPPSTLAQPDLAGLASVRQTLVAKTVQLYLRDKQPDQAVAFLRRSAPEILDQPGFGGAVIALLLQGKNLDPALEVARLMQSRRPGDPAAYQLLVHVYDERKDAEGCIKALRQFAAENPKLPFIRLLLGQKLLATGHEDEGLKLIEQVMDEPSVEGPAGEGSLLPGLVASLLEGKKFDLALKAARLVQKKEPAEPASYLLLEQVYDQLGDNNAFIQAFRQYHKDLPQVRTITLLLGKKLIAAGQTEEGLALVRPLLAADSGVSDLAREVLVAYDAKSDAPERALKLYADALTSDYKDATAILGLSRFIDSLDDKPKVMAAAQPLFKKDLQKVGPAFVLGLLAESYDSTLAADYFQRAIDAQPQFAVAYERRSAMLIQLDRLMDALDTLRQALDSGLSYGAFYRRIGAVYELVDRDPDAIAAYRAALRVDPEDSTPRQRLPRLLVRIGQADKAREMLQEAVVSRPDDPRSYANLGLFESDEDNARTALATVNHALGRLPASSELLYLKASLLRRVRDTAGALKVADQLAALPDGQRAAEELRYSIFLQLKQYDRAEEIVRKLKAAKPDEPDVDYLLAGIYTQKGDDRKAEEVLAGILKGHPRDSAANNDLGFMWADRGQRLAESERMIRIALQENPESAAYLDSLGWVLYKQNKLDSALVYLRRAVRLEPQLDPVVWEHLGDALVRTGHQDQVGPIYEKARAMLKNPDRLAERDDAAVAKRLDRKLKAIKDGQEVPAAPFGPGIE